MKRNRPFLCGNKNICDWPPLPGQSTTVSRQQRNRQPQPTLLPSDRMNATLLTSRSTTASTLLSRLLFYCIIIIIIMRSFQKKSIITYVHKIHLKYKNTSTRIALKKNNNQIVNLLIHLVFLPGFIIDLLRPNS